MDLWVILVSEVSQAKKGKNQMISLICHTYKPKRTNKTETDSDTEYKLVDVKGEIVGKWLRKIKKSELPIIKYINHRNVM